MAQYIYGKNIIKRCLQDNTKIYEIFMLQNDRSLLSIVNDKNIKVKFVDKKTLDKLSNNSNHQGIVASIEEYKTVEVDEILSSVKIKNKGLIVILDGIEDPHNLGAILRSCDCVGVDGVIIKKHNAVGLTPTVAKVSTGAINTVLVSSVTNISTTINKLKDNGYWIVGTGFENSKDYRSIDYNMNVALVIGNEGKGISPLVKKQCDFLANIPMVGKISSLNASVATGVLLYQIYNNRFPIK